MTVLKDCVRESLLDFKMIVVNPKQSDFENSRCNELTLSPIFFLPLNATSAVSSWDWKLSLPLFPLEPDFSSWSSRWNAVTGTETVTKICPWGSCGLWQCVLMFSVECAWFRSSQRKVECGLGMCAWEVGIQLLMFGTSPPCFFSIDKPILWICTLWRFKEGTSSGTLLLLSSACDTVPLS